MVPFSPRFQDQAAACINTNLGRRFGYIDESRNPDLRDIRHSFAGGCFLLALSGDRVVGTGGMKRVDERTAVILRMHTDPDFRRQGIARQILEALERTGLEWGVQTLVLETTLGWQDAAGFYRSQGYRESSRTRDEVFFEKKIGSFHRAG